MKIAILTLPLHTNYGGILQAYALQTVLERMGHDVEILNTDIIRTRSNIVMPLIYVKRISLKALRMSDVPIFLEKKLRHDSPIIRQNTDEFINRHIRARYIKKLSSLIPGEYDCIIAGSDQIWRRPYFCGMWHSTMADAFLSFTDKWLNLIRVAYAASFGTNNLSEYDSKELRECKEAIEKFDSVSVREDDGVDLCKDKFGVNADVVLDPTMLLDKEDYMSLIKQSSVTESSGDMLCYILDPNDAKKRIVDKIANRYGLLPFNIGAKVDSVNLPPEERIQPSVEAWLRGFYDAKFIVTDSFHACAFSIIFEKPFIAVGNAVRGLSRFTSLLSRFGLINRLTTDGDVQADAFSEIDWQKVRKILIDYRTTSIQFITKALQ